LQRVTLFVIHTYLFMTDGKIDRQQPGRETKIKKTYIVFSSGDLLLEIDFISYHIISYHIISYHIISHRLTKAPLIQWKTHRLVFKYKST